MKTRLLSFIIAFLFIGALVGCTDKNINTSKALSTISDYLQEKPIYESASLTLGKTKLRAKKDSVLIANYKKLEEEGYLTFSDETSKKKWLSKDSIWNVTIGLAAKSHPYVIEQKNNRILLKTLEYNVTKESTIQIENKGKRTANAVVLLHKDITPFSILKEDKTPHAQFITKKFRLKFSEEQGWKVTH